MDNAKQEQQNIVVTNDDSPWAFRMPEKFASINKMILRDLNANNPSPRFYLYSRDNIATYLKDPARYEVQLRNAMI